MSRKIRSLVTTFFFFSFFIISGTGKYYNERLHCTTLAGNFEKFADNKDGENRNMDRTYKGTLLTREREKETSTNSQKRQSDEQYKESREAV